MNESNNQSEIVIPIKRYNKVINQPGQVTQLCTFLDQHTAYDIVNDIIVALATQQRVIIDFRDSAVANNEMTAGTAFKKIVNILFQCYDPEFIDSYVTIRADSKNSWLFKWIFRTEYSN